MKVPQRASIIRMLIVSVVFLAVSYFLAFKLLDLGGLVIGDNMYWNHSTINDVLGPRLIRESFLGDIAFLSTFKVGFLFPLTSVFSFLGVSVNWVFPFLFYFLCMASFYLLTGEFLEKISYRIVLSVIFLVNPVVLYYFVSVLFAFTIIFLPLVLKFFIRALKSFQEPLQRGPIYRNIFFCGFFFALCISAHEQFLPTAAILVLFMLIAFGAYSYQKIGFSANWLKFFLFTLAIFAGVTLLVNIPLFLSLNNVQSASLSTYFSGRFSDFIGNVEYTYATANLSNLMRFGGDSGVGLAQSSWFDVFSFTNLFGYALFIIIALSIYLLVSTKKHSPYAIFYWTSLAVFVCAILLIFLVQQLPSNRPLAQSLFSAPLQTWESPTKLRVLLILSGLSLSLLAFQKLQVFSGRIRRGKIVSGLVLVALVASVVIYNSPWIVQYAGSSPISEISEKVGWAGGLYDKDYAYLSDALGSSYQDTRGVMVPYTHKAELYLPPNFRLFQLVSTVNGQLNQFTAAAQVDWSKLLGLLSAKYVVVQNSSTFSANEILLFPKITSDNSTEYLNEIVNDDGFKLHDSVGNFTIYDNENSLPIAYATQYYVLYDNVGTLKYAFPAVDFKQLPVFIDMGQLTNELVVPASASSAVYNLTAIHPRGSATNTTLTITSGDSERAIILPDQETKGNLEYYSILTPLNPGDSVSLTDSAELSTQKQIDTLTLNSSSMTLGETSSFSLNFSVNLIQRGNYSFQGPRVIIGSSNQTQYYLIFHDRGAVELAINDGDVFTPNILTQNLPFDLYAPSDSIDVSVTRSFDEVSVWVNGELALTFFTEPDVSSIQLSSVESTSRFSGINFEERDITKLFAVRQVTSQPQFSVKEQTAQGCKMEINNSGSDYAVVVQYLDNRLRGIETQATVADIRANIFFSGWIINSQAEDSKLEEISIGIPTAPIVLGLTYFSVGCAWFILIVGVTGSSRKLQLFVYRFIKLIKDKWTNGGA